MYKRAAQGDRYALAALFFSIQKGDILGVVEEEDDDDEEDGFY